MAELSPGVAGASHKNQLKILCFFDISGQGIVPVTR
jgi:hypothetical protein